MPRDRRSARSGAQVAFNGPQITSPCQSTCSPVLVRESPLPDWAALKIGSDATSYRLLTDTIADASCGSNTEVSVSSPFADAVVGAPRPRVQELQPRLCEQLAPRLPSAPAMLALDQQTQQPTGRVRRTTRLRLGGPLAVSAPGHATRFERR